MDIPIGITIFRFASNCILLYHKVTGIFIYRHICIYVYIGMYLYTYTYVHIIVFRNNLDLFYAQTII